MDTDDTAPDHGGLVNVDQPAKHAVRKVWRLRCRYADGSARDLEYGTKAEATAARRKLLAELPAGAPTGAVNDALTEMPDAEYWPALLRQLAEAVRLARTGAERLTAQANLRAASAGARGAVPFAKLRDMARRLAALERAWADLEGERRARQTLG